MEVEEGKDSQPASNAHIVSKLSELFGDQVVAAFQTEEVVSEESIKDLIAREADAPIFGRLGLTYGKAVHFKAEFAKIFPQRRVLSRKASPSNVKPRMEDIARFSPEVKSTYLLKRKRVGVLASAHWKGQVPKFNTPERKTELSNFASSILPQCGMPEVGFNDEGIMEHVKTYFNEQRRYKRSKPGLQSESNTSSHSDDSEALKRTIPKMEKWNIQQTKYTLALKCKLAKLTSDPWDTLEDLGNLYKGSLNKPYGYFNWKEDANFGRQRVQGCNPNLLQLCREIPGNLKVTAEMVEPFLEGMTLEDALSKKKIYIMNLVNLSEVMCRFNRVICKPMALFFTNGKNELMPIAIQLFQKPADNNPVFLPSDPKYTWMLAKMYYNNADAAYHQSCTHLGFTHLVAETICVGTHRQLSPSHPVFRLLAPHFLYLLAINSLALAKLVAPNGWIDNTMTTGAGGLMELVSQRWNVWRMNVEGWLPADLAYRGVDDTEALPNYPYRDDALLIFDAINVYVREVLESFYDTPEKLQEDWEIQNWAHMLADPEDGLGIKGVFGDGKFTDLEDLIKVVTSIIFISSVGHSAANFAQYDEYAFPPNYPAFLRGKPPTTKDPLTQKDIINALPVKDMTLDIILVTKILSDRGTNALGDFEVQYMYDPRGTKPVEKFRKRLLEISGEIAERNKSRPFPYPYLDPKEVPNAISI